MVSRETADVVRVEDELQARCRRCRTWGKIGTASDAEESFELLKTCIGACIGNVQTVQYWTVSFHLCSNAWPVDESARSQQIHYTDLPVVILTPQITVPPLLASIFLALVSAQFRLADQTTGERCPSGFSLQRFYQPVKRHIPMGTIF